MAENDQPVAGIRIRNSTDGTIKNNQIRGYDLGIDAADIVRTVFEGNVIDRDYAEAEGRLRSTVELMSKMVKEGAEPSTRTASDAADKTGLWNWAKDHGLPMTQLAEKLMELYDRFFPPG